MRGVSLLRALCPEESSGNRDGSQQPVCSLKHSLQPPVGGKQPVGVTEKLGLIRTKLVLFITDDGLLFIISVTVLREIPE